MAPRGFEDEELTISLSSSHIKRLQQQEERQQHQAQAQAEKQHDGPEVGDNGPGPSHSRKRSGTMNPPREKSARTDQRIGAYKVIRTLGEGSFGKVRLAIHNGTGQKVALKIIARKKLISRDMAGRVEREIEYLQLLRHPHIIKLYVWPTSRKTFANDQLHCHQNLQ